MFDQACPPSCEHLSNHSVNVPLLYECVQDMSKLRLLDKHDYGPSINKAQFGKLGGFEYHCNMQALISKLEKSTDLVGVIKANNTRTDARR